MRGSQYFGSSGACYGAVIPDQRGFMVAVPRVVPYVPQLFTAVVSAVTACVASKTLQAQKSVAVSAAAQALMTKAVQTVRSIATGIVIGVTKQVAKPLAAVNASFIVNVVRKVCVG